MIVRSSHRPRLIEGRYLKCDVLVRQSVPGCPCLLYKRDQEELLDIRPSSLISSALHTSTNLIQHESRKFSVRF